jgi:hypothetical protein
MASQRDFQEQKGRLEEELQAAGQLVIFYPKFHCELNFIERFWCAAKWYGGGHLLPGYLNTLPIKFSTPHHQQITTWE